MRWDERYSEPGYFYGIAPNDFLAENAADCWSSNAEILCVAEGEGRNAVFLAELGFHVTALDISTVGLRKARRLAAERGVDVHCVVADIREYDLGVERWDGIVSIWCHMREQRRVQFHRSVVSALRPGGTLLLESYSPKQLELETGGPRQAEYLMTLPSASHELAGLELVHAEERFREIREGRHHDGPGAVLQVIARKP